jgi:DNA mismatch repair ATPase MutS
MTIAFLEEALIAEKTIPTGSFSRYTPEAASGGAELEYMVLDSQCLQHLEIIESASGKKEGSLIDYIDHCRTPFGKRQLKRWLMSPLLNIQQIVDRQNAV